MTSMTATERTQKLSKLDTLIAYAKEEFAKEETPRESAVKKAIRALASEAVFSKEYNYFVQTWRIADNVKTYQPERISYFKDFTICKLNFLRMEISLEGLTSEYDQLKHAVKSGAVDEAQKLIEKYHLNPDYVTDSSANEDIHPAPIKVNALGLACLKGDEQMAGVLLSKGANPNFALMPYSDVLVGFPQESNDFEPPLLIPAWMALLTSRISTACKEVIWKKMSEKANPLMREGSKWWLSRCFGYFSMKPKDLHMALKSQKNITAATESSQHNKCNFLQNTFYTLGNSYYVISESLGVPPLAPLQETNLKANTIALGAVAIFHGAQVPKVIEDIESRLKVDPNNPILKWAATAAIIQGKPLTLPKAIQIRAAAKKVVEERVGTLLPIEEDAKASRAKFKTAVNKKILPPLTDIVAGYLSTTPEDINGWIAEECMKSTFGE